MQPALCRPIIQAEEEEEEAAEVKKKKKSLKKSRRSKMCDSACTESHDCRHDRRGDVFTRGNFFAALVDDQVPECGATARRACLTRAAAAAAHT